MDRRFEIRKEELLADCKVEPDAFAGVLRRLEQFARPFLDSLPSAESKAHGNTYMSGLLSDVQRKNTESIAYRHDLDRQVLQRFVGYMEWDHEPLLDELTRQVAIKIGEPDAVIVFDPSAFPKRGSESVGVQRQWCGRLGKTENCQLGVYMGYVTRNEQVLVDERLYLSEEWIADKSRRKKCGVPKDVRHQTRHELALEMLEKRSRHLPHGWITGDDEMGRPAWFREKLQEMGERYLLAVPSNTTIRDLEAEVPPQTRVVGANGRVGRRGLRMAPFQQIHAWCAALPANAWTPLVIRDSERGPIEAEVVVRRVESKIERLVVGFEDLLFVLRQRGEGGTWKYDNHLSNAERTTPLAELARVANAEHRIEQCFQRGKSEAGMADYQTRSWLGWHHHQTLSMLAVWFLVLETTREKKIDTGTDSAAGARGPCVDPSSRLRLRHSGADCQRADQAITTQRTGSVLSLSSTETPAAVEKESAGVG